MKITQDVREYAAAHGMPNAVEEGMREKAEEFRRAGGEIYVEEKAVARAPAD
jgi:phosphomethylpyrimidine synthase